jgi:serine protease
LRRRLVTVANLVTIGTITAVLLPGGPAAGAATHSTSPYRNAWQLRAAAAFPAAALAGAPLHGVVRVVTVSVDASGRPRVRVTRSAGRKQAQAAIASDESSPETVAVDVDQRMSDTATSNDTYRYTQWGMDRLKAETAWALHTAAGKTVAVVDTGVDGGQADLAGRVLSGAQFLSSATSTGNGWTDLNGHGTHVAGIIGAIANNGIGVAGLAQGVTILPVRVLDANGSGWTSDIATGVIYAADHGVTAINLSLGGTAADPALAAAIRYAQSKDVVVVAAAGNDRGIGNPVFYPAAYPGVVAVAATDSTNTAASFSETGPYVAIAAPGVSITSTYLGSQYVSASGTSMASPFVAATVALVRAAAPTLSATAAIADIVGTADDLGAPGRDDMYGAGLVDPVAAMQALLKAAPSTAPTTTAPPVITVTAALAISPAQIVAGAAVQATVTVGASSGPAVNGQVSFCTKEIGGTVSCGSPVTTIASSATVMLYPQVGTDLYAKFTPASGLTAVATSATVSIAVAPLVQVTPAIGTLTVTVLQARQQLVSVQRLVGTAWTTVGSQTAVTAAPWKLAALPAGSYRVGVAASTQLLAVTSATVSVR